eukprot:gnl/MRDRNA2_/MRDRNA2_95190_c0_seq1.p1 gnl/MRDRNA2_/MRDRNA2_95190_c0~~gnl/MRDRNA2_/MRDRNA2_95190_c0_seq1.p1  ORF type:complete len:303 (+),score=56.89 gnl/MRDRNA2_/MRDRNA2_95190_c0_seq1:109-1017(+)
MADFSNDNELSNHLSAISGILAGASYGAGAGYGENLQVGQSDASGPSSMLQVVGPSSADEQIVYKTKICSHFQNGICMDGDNCRFAHGAQELRKTRYCDFFGRGVCQKGENCTWAHYEHELMRDVSATGDGPSDEEVRAFGKKWGCDDGAINFVINMPSEVKKRVLHYFNPPLDSTNFSGRLISFAKNAIDSEKAAMEYFDYRKGKGKGKGKKGKGLNSIKPECKVWIGNLDSKVGWKELKEHFDQAGATKWVEPFTKGAGKGTGGVGYASADDAANAINMLNGSILGGQMLEVDVWTKRES